MFHLNPSNMPWNAVATGISSIIGARNTDKTNQANLKINQMNNEFNERMMDKENQFNLDQWNREVAYNDRVRAETNEYNSASSQVQRYREAGLNPTIMMQGQGAGTSQGGSAPSARSGSASASSPIPMQSFTPNVQFGSDLGNLFTTLRRQNMDEQLIAEDVLGKQYDNAVKKATLDSQIAKFLEDLEGSKLDNATKRIFKTNYQNVLNGQVRLMDVQAKQIDRNAELAYTENLLKRKELDTFAQKFGEESALRIAQKTLWSEQANLSANQAKESIAREALLIAQEKGQKISNQQAEAMADDIIKATRNHAKWSDYAPNNSILLQHDLKMAGDAINGFGDKVKADTMEAWKKNIYKPWIYPLFKHLLPIQQ